MGLATCGRGNKASSKAEGFTGTAIRAAGK